MKGMPSACQGFTEAIRPKTRPDQGAWRRFRYNLKLTRFRGGLASTARNKRGKTQQSLASLRPEVQFITFLSNVVNHVEAARWNWSCGAFPDQTAVQPKLCVLAMDWIKLAICVGKAGSQSAEIAVDGF